MQQPPVPQRPRYLARLAETLAPLTLLVVLLLLLQWQTGGKMLSPENLRNVVVRNIPLALVAIGATLVIIAAQIDLAVGSVGALAAVSAGLAFNAQGSFGGAVMVALAVGVTCGLLNGLVTTKAKMPAFVTTLAMMGLARGLALVVSKAQTVSGSSGRDWSFMQTWISYPFLGAPVSIWILLVVAALVWILLAYTTFGRAVYAVGANEPAAHLSGIRTHRVLTWIFVLEGLLVGLAGMINTMQNTSAEPNMLTGLELDAIAAVVIGGASLSGGQGGVGGTLVGVAIMSVLVNGCNLLNVPNQWSKVVIAPLIVLAVVYDRWLKRRAQAAAR